VIFMKIEVRRVEDIKATGIHLGEEAA